MRPWALQGKRMAQGNMQRRRSRAFSGKTKVEQFSLEDTHPDIEEVDGVSIMEGLQC